MYSTPSTLRSLIAGILVGSGFFYTLMVKLDGAPSRGDTFAPTWLAGVLPNLAAAFIVPLMLFIPPKFVRFRDVVRLAAMMFVGLTLYEVMQLQMPRRTFDWYDIIASAVGAMAAVGISRMCFFPQP